MKPRFRYSLRSLVVLTAIVGVIAGFFANRHARVANQRMSIAALKASGARVRLEWQSRSILDKNLPWLPYCYIPVGDVQAGGVVSFNDNDLTPILALPEIGVLELRDTSVSDEGIKRLACADMMSLRAMDLSGTNLTRDGLLALASLPGLTDVVVSGCTELTAADVDAFRQRCKHFVRLHGLR